MHHNLGRGETWRSIDFPGGSTFTHSSEEPLNRAKRVIPELRDIKGSALMYKYGTIWLYRHLGGITTTPLYLYSNIANSFSLGIALNIQVCPSFQRSIRSYPQTLTCFSKCQFCLLVESQFASYLLIKFYSFLQQMRYFISNICTNKCESTLFQL